MRYSNRKTSILVAAVLNGFVSLSTNAQTLHPSYTRYDVPAGHITEIETAGKTLESPVVSDDEKQITWSASRLTSKLVPSALYTKALDSADAPSLVKKGVGRALNIFVKGSYQPNGELVICELEYRPGVLFKTLFNWIKTKKIALLGFRSVVSFYENGKRVSTLGAKEFGLPKDTFLEHPRVSPDGQWLTFYTQDDPKIQGIYVYHRASRETLYLGNYKDKHPTWSGDGTKIFFHEQGEEKASDEEVARIGYYELSFDHGKAAILSRKILTDLDPELGGKYIYQKHPAFHSGLNLVFYHAQEHAHQKQTLAVSSLSHPNHLPILLNLSYEGKRIKGGQHADVAYVANSSLYFVGRIEGEPEDRIFKIDFAALQMIQKQFE